MRVVQFVKCDGEREFLLCERHVLINLFQARGNIQRRVTLSGKKKKGLASSCSWKSSTSQRSLKNLVILSLFSSTKELRGVMNCSLAKFGLFVRFCNILATFVKDCSVRGRYYNKREDREDEDEGKIGTRVVVLRALADNCCSTSM